MTWIKWLLRLLPVVIAIIGVLLVVHRIKGHYPIYRIIVTIVEFVIVTVLACMLPKSYEKTMNDLSSDAMISAPASIPNITYGQAIEAACTDVNWGWFNTSSEEDAQHVIVEVNAKYTYRDVETTMKEILFTMFQKYASQNGITLDESQKEDILYNQAYKEKYEKDSSKEATATPEVTEEPIAEDESTGDDESSNDEDYYVSLIKESSPEAYPDYTYGVVFDNYFSNPNWGYAEIDKQKIVDFTGGCTWNGEDVNCEIQFQLNMDEGTFEVVYYEFDGNQQDLNEWPNVLDKIFGLTYEK